MAFIDLARSRYSERRFSQTPIEPEKIDLILEAGRVAPTARKRQPQRILVVQSPEGLEKIDRCTDCRFGAPAVLVLAYDMTVASRHPDVVDFGRRGHEHRRHAHDAAGQRAGRPQLLGGAHRPKRAQAPVLGPK